MQRLDFSKVDTIILSGHSIEIERGSLEELNVVTLKWYGDIRPVIGFRHRHGGEEGVVAALSVVGFSPVSVADEADGSP